VEGSGLVSGVIIPGRVVRHSAVGSISIKSEPKWTVQWKGWVLLCDLETLSWGLQMQQSIFPDTTGHANLNNNFTDILVEGHYHALVPDKATRNGRTYLKGHNRSTGNTRIYIALFAICHAVRKWVIQFKSLDWPLKFSVEDR